MQLYIPRNFKQLVLGETNCCRTLAITSTGFTAKSHSTAMGIYEYDGITNEKSSYKNKNGNRFLYYSTNGNWKVWNILIFSIEFS